MTEPQMRELVMGTFKDAWLLAQPDVPLVLENEALPTTLDTFALLTIQPTVSQQTTMGPPGTRRVVRKAWIICKLWGPANTGSAGLAALGDAAQRILELKSFPSPVQGDDPVTTYAANAGPSGASTDGRWYMGLVRVAADWWEQI